MTAWERFVETFFKPAMLAQYWPDILKGMLVTVGPALAELADRLGELPVDVIQTLFYSLDPWLVVNKFLRFAGMLISLRRRHPALRRRSFFRGAGPDRNLRPDIIWHGTEPFRPDFSPGSRTLAYCLDGTETEREPDRDFYVACNGWRETISFRIPPAPTGRRWRRAIDTSLLSPLDIIALDEGPVVASGTTYPVSAHSLIVLISESGA